MGREPHRAPNPTAPAGSPITEGRAFTSTRRSKQVRGLSLRRGTVSTGLGLACDMPDDACVLLKPCERQSMHNLSSRMPSGRLRMEGSSTSTRTGSRPGSLAGGGQAGT